MKKNSFLFIFFFLAISLPVFLVFKEVFTGNALFGGDAPFFYPQGLRELVSEPLVWTERGINFGGDNLILWLSPLMFLYGLFGSVFQLGNNLGVRLIFYIPSIIFAVIGPYFLARYLKLSKLASFFASFFYTLNTYFILLIDGGQVGVALAYGIFPLTLLFLRRFLDSPKLNSFFVGLIFLVICGIFDPRIALILLVSIVVWVLGESFFSKKIGETAKLGYLVLILTAWLSLNAFWIYPLVRISVKEISGAFLNVDFVTLLNSLFLFQPHWSGNEFGKVVQTPFYFVLIPVLIFAGLFFKNKSLSIKSFYFCFLILTFISAGSNVPLGSWYEFLISKVPLGFSFRDSSKFFTPLMLFAGILIGETVSRVLEKIGKGNFLRFIFVSSIYLYLLFLVYPALTGRLNFVLSTNKTISDFQTVYNKIGSSEEYFRTLWFSEKPSLAFESIAKPAISAKDLATKQPFAQINASEDVFNFLNNFSYVDWLKVFNIKYLLLPGDLRNITPSQEDIGNWDSIKSLVDETNGLVKEDWGTNFPVYRVDNILPKSFVVEKIVAVVGPMPSIAGRISPSVYFEDGKWDPSFLNGKPKDSIEIFFNGKEKLDLAMSFLQKHFKSAKDFRISDWANYGPEEYLKYKYELLIRDLSLNDFDYGKGISFSTLAREKMETSLKVTKKESYMLAIRGMKKAGGEKIKVIFNEQERDVDLKEDGFGWNILGPFNLTKGSYKLSLVNNGGLQVVNTVALVPKSDFDKAGKTADVFIASFGSIKESKITKLDWQELNLKKEGTLKYTFEVPKNGSWIIFTDNYSSLWQMRRWIFYTNSIPVYSMANAFYLDPAWQDLHIEYRGQDFSRWGMTLSGISFLVLLTFYVYLSAKKDERKNLRDIKN